MRPWIFSFALLLASPAVANPIVGRASVTDGDTLVIRETRIRLHGIDAPESAQTCKDATSKDYRCGQAAALALADHIGKRMVTCEPRDTDRYGRVVALCRADAEDLNAWMVREGHAIAYRRYAEDYVNAELTAKALRTGIWAGTFQDPSEWRRAHRAGGEDTRPETVTPPTGKSGCTIKGNISAGGQRIYHLPGSRDYDWTRVNDRAGERMFCTGDEAKAAGWRAAR
ncbi:thermonuclease family protein [Methylobacterium sp. Leaf466]|uniref:thermonuclease family protein n=1 Tax=Methylobacterium sp. Leaf466 TaxID=1736386 RepID=UPI0006FBA2A6|nr:thermonuclease family protein [Methylobacterium sp. Leaf466]KQT80554.1 nuclease [Methylobacterium sp. Leaf466]